MAKAYRSAGPWLSAVWQFTGSVMVATAMGYGVDRWLGVAPWGMVVGGVVGTGVGFYAFITATNRIFEGSKKK